MKEEKVKKKKEKNTEVQRLRNLPTTQKVGIPDSVGDVIDNLTKENKELSEKNKRFSEIIKAKTKAVKDSELGKKELAKSLGEAEKNLEQALNKNAKAEAEYARKPKLHAEKA